MVDGNASIARYMGAVMLFTLSTGVSHPISPLFAVSLGVSIIYVGALNSIGVAANAIVRPISGRLSDRFGRAVFMIAGLLVLTVGNAIYAVAPRALAILLLTIATIFIGIGAASFWPALKATVVERYPGRRERAFGYVTAVQGGATAVGAAVGGVVANTIGYRWAFGVSACCLGLAALLVLSNGGQSVGGAEDQSTETPAALPSKSPRLRHGILVGIALVGFVSIAVGAIVTFLSLYAVQVYHVSLTVVGIMFTGVFLGQGAGAFAAAHLSDREFFTRIGSGLILCTELLLAAMLAIATPFMSFVVFVAGQILLAVLLSAAFVGLYARTTELVSSANLAATIGSIESIGMAASLLGPLLGGVVFRFDRAFFFPASGLLLAAAVTTLIVVGALPTPRRPVVSPASSSREEPAEDPSR